MKPIFNSVKLQRPGKNVFDLSHERKMSCKMADLIPILVEEVVPGDKFQVSTEVFARLAPMLAPMMHRVNIYTHYFFVPNRLTWNEWEGFITGGEQGTLEPAFPQITLMQELREYNLKGTLADFMGIPSIDTSLSAMYGDTKVSALPFRAYQMIYNEYYRDQNVMDKIEYGIGGEVTYEDAVRLMTMRKRCWEKDYFTSALPWAQRGGDVLIPMEADVIYKNQSTIHAGNIGQAKTANSGPLSSNAGDLEMFLDPTSVGVGIQNIESIENGSLTINDLRRATRLQQWLERNARAGSRYIEQIFSHFGVRSSDARLQRPEYLGGSKQPISISEVLNTAGSETNDPVGTMSGHGVSAAGNFMFNKYFEEHGYIIGIMSILPRTAYMQGLPRFLTKFDKFDYYFPEFAHLGEQEIKQKEIKLDYLFAPTISNEATFGYQSRYSEYKFKESSVHGDFRDNMNYWHMGRIFDAPPELNADFVQAAPTDRVFAVTDPTIDKIYIQLYNKVRAIRPMPIFGTPSL